MSNIKHKQNLELKIEKIVSIIENEGSFVIRDPEFNNPEYLAVNIKNLLSNIGGWLSKHRPGFKKSILVIEQNDSIALTLEDNKTKNEHKKNTGR